MWILFFSTVPVYLLALRWRFMPPNCEVFYWTKGWLPLPWRKSQVKTGNNDPLMMGKLSWVSNHSPMKKLVSQSLTQWNVEQGLYRLVKGFLQNYLQLPATWVAKTVLPPEKEHVSKKGTILKGIVIFQPSIFRRFTFVFRGVSLCMTLTGRLRYFFRAITKKKEHTFSWPLPESYMVVSIQSFHKED